MKRRQNILFNQADSVIQKLFWDSFFVIMASKVSVGVSKLIDSLMVSNFLGSEMFAAQSLSSPLFGFIAIASGLLATGTQVLVSKNIVKGQFKESDQIFSLALFVGLVISGLMTVACVMFGGPLANILGASREDAALFESTKAYLMGLGIGAIPITMNMILPPVLQINGDRKRIKITMFVIAGANFILNLVAIFVFKWGMFGVGLATGLAEWIGTVCYLLHFRKRNIMCHICFRGISLFKLKNVLSIGLPQATVRVCNTLRPLLVNRWILFLSTSAAISAVGINNNIVSFFLIPQTAVASAVMLIAGTFYEEQDKESLNKLVRLSMEYNVLINVILAVGLFISAPLWVSIYEKRGSETFEMAVTCIRWAAVGMMCCAVNAYFVNFMQGTGRHQQVHLFAIFQKFVYSVGCAYVLGWLFGIQGVLASMSVCEMCFMVHILIHIWVKNKKFPKKMGEFLLLPKGFGNDPNMTLDYSITSMEEVIGISEEVMDFCRERGIDRRRAYFAALCTEEMASNIVRHGFSKEKKQSLMIRVLIVNGDLILRFRDSCRLFNIRERYETIDKQDVTKNIGIRMVMSIAKDVMYVNALNLNTTIIKI